MGILDRITGKKTPKPPTPKEEKTSDIPAAKQVKEVKPAKTDKAAAKPKTEAKTAKPKTSGNYSHVLRRPYLTEKSYSLSEKNQVIFEVAPTANKIEVTLALKEMYGVTPTSVRMIVQKGKNVRFRRIKGKQKDLKKAVVTLPKGQQIDVFEHAK